MRRRHSGAEEHDAERANRAAVTEAEPTREQHRVYAVANKGGGSERGGVAAVESKPTAPNVSTEQ